MYNKENPIKIKTSRRSALAFVTALVSVVSYRLVDAFPVAPSWRPASLVQPSGLTQTWAFSPRAPLSIIDAEYIDEEPTGFPTTNAVIKNQDAEIVKEESATRKLSTDPTPFFVSLFDKVALDPKLAFGATALALVLMATTPLDAANAAMSGGRMGGSFSAPSPSRMSVPTRSYGGGGGGYYRGGGNVYSSRTYISPGWGGGVLSPVAPIIPMTPYYNPIVPRPMYFGGPGAMVYNRGPSLFDLMLIGGIGFFILNTIRNASAGNFSSYDEVTNAFGESVSTPLGTGTSVAQVTVALEVPNRDDPNSILGVLNRLAQTANTDNRKGIQNLTSQVALELLRRKSSIVSGASRYKYFKGRSQAQRHFNALSIKERGKFEHESTSQYGGVKYTSPSSQESNAMSKATLAVVTLIINIDGDSTKLPTISSIRDLEEALRKIAADSKVSDCLQGAEILWTPEDRSEVLTTRDIVADYPELSTV